MFDKLIACFRRPSPAVIVHLRADHPDKLRRVLAMIRANPGGTTTEIARIIYGPEGYQQLINDEVRTLERTGKIRREGQPFRLYALDS